MSAGFWRHSSGLLRGAWLSILEVRQLLERVVALEKESPVAKKLTRKRPWLFDLPPIAGSHEAVLSPRVRARLQQSMIPRWQHNSGSRVGFDIQSLEQTIVERRKLLLNRAVKFCAVIICEA